MLPNNQLNLRQSNRSIYLKILFFLLIFHFFSSTLISCLFHLFFNSLFTSFHLLLYRSLPHKHTPTQHQLHSFIHSFFYPILNALFLSSSTTPRGTLMFYFSNLLFFVSFLFQLFFLLPPLSLLPQTIFLYFSHHITLCSNLLISAALCNPTTFSKHCSCSYVTLDSNTE